MKASRPLAFVVLAFVVGATISQASFAFADDSSTNPFRAIWDAISELQTKTDSLQAQIDDLRELRGTAATEPVAAARISEPSVAIEVGSGQSGQTIIQVIARNAGPENAVGVKLSTYYEMSLFSVNFIEGAECTDQARGIIECYLGTLDAGSEARIAIDVTPVSLGQQAVITTDISSITEDANPANNRAEMTFITSEAPVVIPPVIQPEAPVQQPQEQVPAEQPVQQPPAEQPQEQPPGEEPVEQTPPAEQPSEQPQESQEQPAEEPAEQQNEQPAEQPQEQPPAEQPPAEQPSAPSSGEPSPPPPPPPSGGETG